MYAKSVIIIICLFSLASNHAEIINYEDHIQDWFGQHCQKCHNEDKSKGGLNLMSYTAMMQGGSTGLMARPGKPEESLVMRLIKHEEEPYMPPKKPMMPKKDIELLNQFIKQGMRESSKSKAVKAKKAVSLAISKHPNTKHGKGPMPKKVINQTKNFSLAANAVSTLAHSPNAPLLAVGGLEQVLLYHSGSKQLLGIWPFKEGDITDLSFSADGHYLIAAGGNPAKSGRIAIWYIAEAKRKLTIGKEYDTIFSASISSDMQRYVSTSASSLFKLSTITDSGKFKSIKKHTNWITNLRYSPDGVLLASSGRDGDLYIWESHSGQQLYQFNHHKKKITELVWRSDSNILVSASEDGTIAAWDVQRGRKIKHWKAHGPGVLSVDFSDDGRIASAGRDKLVKIWKADGKLQHTLKGFKDLPLKVCFGLDQNTVFVGEWSGQLKAWDLKTKKAVTQLPVHFLVSEKSVAKNLKKK